MEIKILGSGCAKCNELEANAVKAAAELGVDAQVQHVSDFQEIMSFGVMTTPALVVDGVLKTAGRVPNVDEVKGYLGSGGCCGGSAAPSGSCGCGEGGCC